MDNQLIASIVAPLLVFIIWWAKKKLSSGKEGVEREKIKSESDVDYTVALRNLTDTVENLQELYQRQLEKNSEFIERTDEQDQALDCLQVSYNKMFLKSKEWEEKYLSLSLQFDELKKENDKLRRVVIQNEIDRNSRKVE